MFLSVGEFEMVELPNTRVYAIDHLLWQSKVEVTSHLVIGWKMIFWECYSHFNQEMNLPMLIKIITTKKKTTKQTKKNNPLSYTTVSVPLPAALLKCLKVDLLLFFSPFSHCVSWHTRLIGMTCHCPCVTHFLKNVFIFIWPLCSIIWNILRS